MTLKRTCARDPLVPYYDCPEGEKVEGRGGSNSLGQRPALADGDLVAVFDTECGGDVGSEVLVALLVTVVFGDVVQVLAADDEGAVHLGRDDGAGEDTATDGDQAGEGALFV